MPEKVEYYNELMTCYCYTGLSHAVCVGASWCEFVHDCLAVCLTFRGMCLRELLLLSLFVKVRLFDCSVSERLSL